MDQKPGSAADQAYSYVRERVISGDFAAGTRLTEWQIADALGTSRTPVREAMRRLVGDGFLRFQRNYGTFVGTYTAKEIGELFDVRALLESEVAGAAARGISAMQLERLTILQAQIEEAGRRSGPRNNLARIATLNRDFRLVVAQASDSPRMVNMLTNAIQAPVVQQTFGRYSEGQLQRSFHHHRELIDAFRTGTASWARDAMSCHVRGRTFRDARLDIMVAGRTRRRLAGCRRRADPLSGATSQRTLPSTSANDTTAVFETLGLKPDLSRRPRPPSRSTRRSTERLLGRVAIATPPADRRRAGAGASSSSWPGATFRRHVAVELECRAFGDDRPQSDLGRLISLETSKILQEGLGEVRGGWTSVSSLSACRARSIA